MPAQPPPHISVEERRMRIAAVAERIHQAGMNGILLSATTSLRYFTGIAWHPSERFLGALVHADGEISYITPRFELGKVSSLISIAGEVLTWEEDESPYELIGARLGKAGFIGLDPHMPLFMYQGLRAVVGDGRLADAGPLVAGLRSRKSPAEIALMAHAKSITLEVHRRAWARLREGVRASEIARFIDAEHRTLGEAGSTFCIVSFAEDTSLPHGGETDRSLKGGDVVLIDTGTQIDGYNSDITRTYVFGEAATDVRQVWAVEKEAQGAAFAAAQIGRACESVDAAAREVIERAGFGPGYRLPGLPHRTGHGIGLDVHEAPNLVRGDTTLLEPGMCFSNEPMIVVPGRFGVRLEDHFYMTKNGPRWFTEPQASLEEPFANAPVFNI